MKRHFDLAIEGDRSFPPPMRSQVERGQFNVARLGENRLTALPRDVLLCVARHVDLNTLRHFFVFLFEAYGIARHKLFTEYQDEQHAVLCLMRDVMRETVLHPLYEAWIGHYIAEVNAPTNFPGRIQPEEAAQRTDAVVRAHPFTALFLYVRGLHHNSS